ncbi:hypothetical protein cypCar_00045503 [Cyprinus carpio]|nr:hypothetical protein cypCar_00045503 [Cyprinus carpio]
MKVYSCALLRDILLQGRLYISRNWLCFYANLFGKDIKVCVPVVSVRLVKKHKTAGLVPNGLVITTDSSQKYVFVSLLSRDSVYDVLRRICTHLQVNGKQEFQVCKQFLEEPGSLSTDEFPSVTGNFTPVLKSADREPVCTSRVFIHCRTCLGNSTEQPDAPADTPPGGCLCLFWFGKLFGELLFVSVLDALWAKERRLEAEKVLLTEPESELGHMEYHLLKFFILLIILLIFSSCYLAFRVCSLEQQLSLLNTQPAMSVRER